MTDYPKKISVEWINKELAANKFPNIYPNAAFRQEHWKIIQPYIEEIKLYKGYCYKELNTYFKTGKVLMQGGCPKDQLEAVMKKVSKTGLTPEEQVKLVADRLEELYSKVKPLDHDTIIYRGIARGTIGQNLFTGECIKSRLYDLPMHRFCEDQDIITTTFFQERGATADPRDYIAETLGFVSTTTAISTAVAFSMKGSERDTIMALRLPAGTKFIMPLSGPTNFDHEYELILFPLHNTYTINNSININIGYPPNNVPVYVGAICNELNKYRRGKPKLRQLRVPILNPGQWAVKMNKEKPLLLVNPDKCENSTCGQYVHYCDPETGSCLAGNPESEKKIQDWWRTANKKAVCTEEKVDTCVDQYKACDPDTGECMEPSYNYSSSVKNKVINWVSSKDIIKQQKPRYKCDEKKIQECADKKTLCNPTTGACIGYSENNVWWVNNVLPAEELAQLVPTGKCTEVMVKQCAGANRFCDPDTGYCFLWMDKSNESKIKKILAEQTKEAKEKWAVEKSQQEKKKQALKKKIIADQKPRYKCTQKKITDCAEIGKVCHPVHKYQNCRDTTEKGVAEDLYYVNNVIDTAELKALKPYGKCTTGKINECAQVHDFCDPGTGYCLQFNTTNKPQVASIHKELAQQKPDKDYNLMTIVQLKKELREKGLAVSGKKAELIARLISI